MVRFVIIIAFNGFYVGETGCAPMEFVTRFSSYLRVLDGAC